MLWKPLEAAKLDKRIQLVPRTDGAANSFNEPALTDGTALEVWAGIEDIDGSEPFFAEQATPATSHVVTIRYRPGLTPKWGIHYGPGWARKFEIEKILDPMQRHEQLVLFVKEQFYPQ